MNEKINLEEWSFTSFPQQLTQKDYKDALSYFLEESCEDTSLSSLYLYGSSKKVSVPGISDLDFVVISNNPSSHLKNLFSVQGTLPKKYKNILYHDDMFLSEELARHRCYFQGNLKTNWNYVCGKKASSRAPSKISYEFKTLEEILFHNYRALCTFYLTKKIHVRSLLHSLSHVRYNLLPWPLQEKNPSLYKKILSYLKKVDSLRNKWFTLDVVEQKKQLIQLLLVAVHIYASSLSYIDAYIKKTYLISMKAIPEKLLLHSTSFPIIFKDVDNYLEETIACFSNQKRVVLFLPRSFSCTLAEYQHQNGRLASYISKNLTFSSSFVKNQYMSHLKERLFFYESFLQYVKEHYLEVGPLVHFDLHQRKPFHKKIYHIPRNIFKKRKLQSYFDKL